MEKKLCYQTFTITALLGAVFLIGGHVPTAEAFSARGSDDGGRGEKVNVTLADTRPSGISVRNHAARTSVTHRIQKPVLYIEERAEGQVSDETLYLDGDDMPLFAFSLRPRGVGTVEVSELALRLVVARGLTLDEVSKIRLYRTTGLDTLSEDDLVGEGVLSQGPGSRGTIAFVFTEALSLDGATDFLVVADLDGSGDTAVMNIGLQSRGVVAEGSVRTIGSVVATHHLGRKPVDDDDDDDGDDNGDDGDGNEENDVSNDGGDRTDSDPVVGDEPQSGGSDDGGDADRDPVPGAGEQDGGGFGPGPRGF